VCHGRWKGEEGWAAPLDFAILHFSITFLAKKVVFLFSRWKNEISSLLPNLEISLWLLYLWKNALLAPSRKNPSDVHGVYLLLQEQVLELVGKPGRDAIIEGTPSVQTPQTYFHCNSAESKKFLSSPGHLHLL